MVIILAICLSLDAFSLSLAYGTSNISKKDTIILSVMVGIFHILMPILGYFIGDLFLSFVQIKPSFIAAIIFIILGIEMFIDTFKDESVKEIKDILELLLFSFAVSIDSFSTGFGIGVVTNHYVIAALIFGLFSFLFTFFGILLGKFLNHKLGMVATVCGSIVLAVLGIYYLFI